MSEITRTSFYYDPIRQGYDTNSWKTISGAPAVTGNGRMVVDAGTGTDGIAVHYADFLKGDISFDVNVPSAPAGGDSRLFGVSAPGATAYIRFSIGADLTCQTSDGITTTNSSAITWDSNWTGANTIFRIRWEAGTAKFFVSGTQVYSVSDASVPHGPLSLYLFDNSTSAMTIGDMNVRGTQSFVMSPKTSDSTANNGSGNLSRFESITVTDVPTFLLVNLSLPYVSEGLSDSVTVTEAVTLSLSLPGGSIFDLVTITEDIQISMSLPSPIVDSVTITESMTLTIV